MKTFTALVALATAASLSAQTETPAPSPGQIVAEAASAEWEPIPADELMVLTLAPGADGNERQVVIQLMPAPFSQGWVENIKLLARSGWYDNTSVNRVQDNYVVQWGDPNYDNPEGDPSKVKPLPDGLKVMGENEYVVDGDILGDATSQRRRASRMEGAEAAAREAEMASAAAKLEDVFRDAQASEAAHELAVDEFLIAAGLSPSGGLTKSEEQAMLSISATKTSQAPHGWHERDSYSEWVEFWFGWPIANFQEGSWKDQDGKSVPDPKLLRHQAAAKGFHYEVSKSVFWPVHCYGMVGVGRNYSPDTGSGAELYAVIGHAPRHLDRNIALVGRVIEGIEHLSSLPRGKGEYAFYADAAKRTPILSVRLGTEVEQFPVPRFEYLSTESETFARYVEARANRRDPFFIAPARGVDICNIPVPIRRVPAE